MSFRQGSRGHVFKHGNLAPELVVPVAQPLATLAGSPAPVPTTTLPNPDLEPRQPRY